MYGRVYSIDLDTVNKMKVMYIVVMMATMNDGLTITRLTHS